MICLLNKIRTVEVFRPLRCTLAPPPSTLVSLFFDPARNGKKLDHGQLRMPLTCHSRVGRLVISKEVFGFRLARFGFRVVSTQESGGGRGEESHPIWFDR
ncbi:hypothetical protein L596_013279 [Steinernema carpocapsae]|uniref:Uncharacterized protein n=1 Tax=Steinernema carpocapsae TaxID=34508 RepID=A0A4U5P0J0_STECR|nr:hypothetical protein L596_013279 [Steinernema carpocapsae]